ncbi:hypothetical protein CJ739_1391 [Mariniflexile rhizosphaerae]|uniref:hypothetical protein n=1 Tax=unclassified Mariniflexile TaxID=2643887 RepID=UPI000E32FB77|nr:hypothetical protein [Mariniflexile sp. TRM1-10]AXP80480.1 hypothetical protein CJ739_1391 [Mariniflexile sp. TRM1-10]
MIFFFIQERGRREKKMCHAHFNDEPAGAWRIAVVTVVFYFEVEREKGCFIAVISKLKGYYK